MREVAPTLATKAELARRLAVVRSNIPALLGLFPERRTFFNEFASFVDDVKVRARSKDQEWVDDQIRQMLEEHGIAAAVSA